MPKVQSSNTRARMIYLFRPRLSLYLSWLYSHKFVIQHISTRLPSMLKRPYRVRFINKYHGSLCICHAQDFLQLFSFFFRRNVDTKLYVIIKKLVKTTSFLENNNIAHTPSSHFNFCVDSLVINFCQKHKTNSFLFFS